MKTTVLVLFTLLFSFCSAEEINGVSYSLAEDGRKWKSANGTKNDQQEIQTYILAEETPENWSELFVAQSIKGLKIEPQKFYSMLIEKLKTLAPANKIETKIIEESDTDLLAEWWIKDQTPQDQHEWIRLIQGKDAFIVLRYTAKKDPSDKNLTAWKSALKGAKPKEG